jgi:hypothetical protein
MPQVCRTCSRLNPEAARYCYHDGAALLGVNGGPVAGGSRIFLSPFVFPSGKACRSFDELVLACEGDWDAARDLLREGFLEGFLGGIGRADLAVAAKQARQEADADRALDLFLKKLPGERPPPVLVVAPREVNLGQVKRGEDRSFVLHLENQGMGLLSATAASEVPWLALGEAPGAGSKVIQYRHETTLTVQVHGKALRAHPRPQEGRIVITSSGGNFTLPVRVEVPMQPFPDGVLAGALTPRQVAEKARAQPHRAAPLFESGAVARWYELNGWTYPVRGPAASGMAAVQQFFEALGLTRPPALQISQTAVELSGAPGSAVEAVVFVESAESRPVYAHGQSEANWLHVGKGKSQGNSVRLTLRVPAVPPLPNQKLNGRAIITANGNQQFVVDVTLHVGAGPALPPLPPPEALSPPLRFGEGVGGWGPSEPESVKADAVQPLPLPPLPQAEQPAAPARSRLLVHLLPLFAILLFLVGAVVHDFWLPSRRAGDEEDAGPALIDPTPVLALRFHDGPTTDRLKVPAGTMSFGLTLRDTAGRDRQGKRLTFDEKGRTNNVCVRIDGLDYLFGMNDIVFDRPDEAALEVPAAARWVKQREPLGKDAAGRQREGARSVWQIDGFRDRRCKLLVTQTVEVVPGAQSGRLDTCLVRYSLDNADNLPHEVGIRFLLDTYIGDNDGAPFTVPGRAELCATKLRFDGAAVPDYIEALEKDSLLDPGTVARVQFRLSGPLESPSSVYLGGYPDRPLQQLGYRQANGWFTPWEVPFVSIRELAEHRRQLRGTKRDPVPDSAVTLFWEPKTLAVGQRRDVGFAYGLGAVSSAEGEGKLLLSVGGRAVRDGELTLTALRAKPAAGERLTLELPPGERFALVGRAEQAVPPVPAGSSRPLSAVTWRLKALRVGRSVLTVRSSAGVSQKQSVRISPPVQGVLD